jgi:dolichyl-phosphate beta-glucosyltransferase
LPQDASPWLSVVIPAFNEAERIVETLGAIQRHLRTQPYTAEIIVVDDGSEDGTFEVVRRTADALELPLRAFRYSPNAGKGYALKHGFAQARGERILFTDADLSTPIEEADRLLDGLERGADVVIGSRKMAGAAVLVHQRWYRERLGKVFTWMVRWLIADVSDATCGFKVFRRAAGQDIFSRLRISDWSFDAELLMLTGRLGYRLAEVPVRWADRPGTKVRLLRDGLSSLYGLGRIWVNAARGVYRTPCVAARASESWEAARAPQVRVSISAG